MSQPDPISVLRHREPGRSFVVAQLGQSLDGRIATPAGESQWINGEGALDHVHRIRAAVDAVLVGVGTVVADDPRLDVRRCAGPNPARVVLDPSGRMPAGARCLRNDGARRVVVRCRPGPVPDGVEEILVTRHGEVVSPADVIAALAGIGLYGILVEGGARTVSGFIAAGCVDRLHLLVAPVILGSGRQGIDLPPIRSLAQALRPAVTAHGLPGGDVLFDCDLRAGGLHAKTEP